MRVLGWLLFCAGADGLRSPKRQRSIVGLPQKLSSGRRHALRVRGGGLVDARAASLAAVRRMASRPGGWAVFACCYVAVELCGLPGVPLAVAAGASFPPLDAIALVLGSAAASAAIAYEIGRSLLRPRLARRIEGDRRLGAIDAAVRDNGFAVLLLLRFVPMPPAINYVYGAMAPRRAAYTAATVLGYVPGTVLTVLGAAGLAADRPPPAVVAAGAAGAAVLALLLAATARRARATLASYEAKLP